MRHVGAAIGIVIGDRIEGGRVATISYSETHIYFHGWKQPSKRHKPRPFVFEYRPLDNVAYDTDRTIGSPIKTEHMSIREPH